MYRHSRAFRRVAGVGMIIVGLQPWITSVININAVIISALIFLVAGVAILGQLGRPSIGMTVLAFWLIAQGVLLILNQLGTFDFPLIATILSVTAILAGVLLIIDR